MKEKVLMSNQIGNLIRNMGEKNYRKEQNENTTSENYNN